MIRHINTLVAHSSMKATAVAVLKSTATAVVKSEMVWAGRVVEARVIEISHFHEQEDATQ